jgi:CheY-like chemotaxis protein
MTATLSDSVLVVDDEMLISQFWCAVVEDMGLAVCGTAMTADTAVIAAVRHRPKVVLMDMRLRGKGDGVDASQAIHDQVGSKVIFITGSKEPATLARINGDHPTAVLIKPVSDRQLRSAIRDAMRPEPTLV